MCFSGQCWCVDFISEVLWDLKVILPSIVEGALTQVSHLFSQGMKEYNTCLCTSQICLELPSSFEFLWEIWTKKKSPFSVNIHLTEEAVAEWGCLQN